jgi:hypothetical protein
MGGMKNVNQPLLSPLPLPSPSLPNPGNRHFDRSCSQSHREQRSGEIRFSATTLPNPTTPLPFPQPAQKTSMPFEVLDRLLVLLRLFARRKRPQVLPPSRLRILVPRIDPKLSALYFTNHLSPPFALRCRQSRIRF